MIRRRDWLRILGYSGLISASVLCVFAYALGPVKAETPRAVSIAFVALAGAQLFHVFNMRDRSESVLRNQITKNRYVWWALALCGLLLAAALHIAPVARVLGLQIPTLQDWALIAIGAIAPFLIVQSGSFIRRLISNSRTRTESGEQGVEIEHR